MQTAIKAVKDAAPEMCVITETCLCPYTENGQCVLVNDNGRVDIEGTHSMQAQMALQQVEVGADIVGPAGMLEGTTRAIRRALDADNHFAVPIMPHLIFASKLYAPYYQTMKSAPSQGHRRPFHLDPSRPMDGVQQARLFLEEGATMLLVEPALPVLDFVATLRSTVTCPIGAFSVSGEFELLTRAQERDGSQALIAEFMGALARAGADFIVTYAAADLAGHL
jgi:porphobilinogen synthase